jgi:hypothetical protein
MQDEPEIEESKAFATGWYRGAEIVSRYMKDRYPLIEGAITNSQVGHRESCLKGLWTRAYAWMNTLARLNDPLDFQAISVGNRALLEIAVDLVLLHNDKTNGSGWKMHWWAMSEKLKASEQIIKFYEDSGLPLPGQYEVQEIFLRDESAGVTMMRSSLWPNRKNPSQHPARWTGNGNLGDDILEADRLYGPAIKEDLGSTLEEFYRTEYRKMNWRIHSGSAAFWNQPPQAYFLICGFGYKWGADLSMLSTKILLKDFGYVRVLEGLEAEWESVNRQRNLAYLEALNEFHNRDLSKDQSDEKGKGKGT